MLCLARARKAAKPTKLLLPGLLVLEVMSPGVGTRAEGE